MSRGCVNVTILIYFALNYPLENSHLTSGQKILIFTTFYLVSKSLIFNKLTICRRWWRFRGVILKFAGNLRDQAPLLLSQGFRGAKNTPEAPRRRGGSLSHCRWLLMLHLKENKTVFITRVHSIVSNLGIIILSIIIFCFLFQVQCEFVSVLGCLNVIHKNQDYLTNEVTELSLARFQNPSCFKYAT